MSRMRKFFIVILVLIIAGAIVFYMGPRTPVSTEISFDPSTIGEDVEVYIAQSEARFDDIRKGLNKQIVWAYPNSRAKTPIALVYVHGFSASPGEIRPVMDIVASTIGANLFYTRLAGHGRDGDAMGEATIESWVNDLAEAEAVGRRIGERIILVGTSTGGTIVSWAATQSELSRDVAGIVNISPNFNVQAAGAALLTIPWANQLVQLITGKRRKFEPQNELHEQNWTHEYPTTALLPMAELVKLANASSFEEITIPALFIFSEKDKVVKPDVTRRVAERWGADSEIVLVEDSGDENNHVIAGDALSPSTNQSTADTIIGWINRLPGGDG
jgi:esterase/lipase